MERFNMNNETEFQVTSEILSSFERDTQAKPLINEMNVVSKFAFTLPESHQKFEGIRLKKDGDGDYILKRKGDRKYEELFIFLEHSVSTELRLVGLQIWRAALLMADFILHSQRELENKTVLELGSGVGLTSIVAGMFAQHVICTDLDVGNILQLIKTNMERNKNIIRGQVTVSGLDFFNREWPTDFPLKLNEVTVVLAADVIYDNDLTEAFVETVIKILSVPPKKTLYLALEKRYVFTMSDLDSVAPCYEHLMTCLRSAKSKPPFSQWELSEVPLDFPQYFNYERVKQLVMYKITT